MPHKLLGRVQKFSEKDLGHGDFMIPVLSRSNLTESKVELATADFPLLDVLAETEVPTEPTAAVRIA